MTAHAPKIRVFVIEDHASTARALKTFLEASDCTVEVAVDLKTALRAAPALEFDVLLCDLNLPDGTGWDLMERLQQRAPVRGIAYSAFNEPEHIARSKKAGFVEHIVKGTSPENLLAAIQRVCRNGPAIQTEECR